MKLYIAVIGQTCAGKETTFQLVKKEFNAKRFDVSIHHFSDPLNEILEIIGQPKSRPNQQGLSTDLRQRFGENLLGNVIKNRILADSSDIVFLDGVRRPKDVEMLKNLPNSYLVYVSAPIEKRFERLKRRADRPGDAEKTWEEFRVEQAAEAESLIETLRPYADLELDNSEDDPGEFVALKKQIIGFITSKLNEKGGKDAA